MTESPILKFLHDAEEANPKFAEYRKKAAASAAVFEETSEDDDVTLYRGYVVDADDASVFQAQAEVDEYLTILADFKERTNEK